MKRVAVYCGSSPGHDPVFKKAAEDLADYFTDNNLVMVNGGGHVGIMGIMADRMISRGGVCEGVIAIHLKDKELAHEGMNEMIVTPCMHSRKKYIMDSSDAFIAFPGGYGTLDELFECITWRQLNLHDKEVGILNVNGYFDPMLEMIDNMYESGFMNGRSRNILHQDKSIEGLFQKLKKGFEVKHNKWEL